ncbi:hypothetical protein Q5P01_014623 [Channa striata]|uniref:Uncharacterized protein n=1 Tax=Channa striata TaxID=64152 RepID=A0AA88SGX8_CHASR|nr:hypothetical protein Q5P01_014623 [Channa striata]
MQVSGGQFQDWEGGSAGEGESERGSEWEQGRSSNRKAGKRREKGEKVDNGTLKEGASAAAVTSGGAAFHLDKTDPPTRQGGTWQSGIWRHGEMRMRCNLWRVLLDYGTVTLMPLHGILWGQALTNEMAEFWTELQTFHNNLTSSSSRSPLLISVIPHSFAPLRKENRRARSWRRSRVKHLDVTTLHFESTLCVFGKLVSDVKDEKCCSVVFYTRCWL